MTKLIFTFLDFANAPNSAVGLSARLFIRTALLVNEQTALAVLSLDFGLPKYVIVTAEIRFVTLTLCQEITFYKQFLTCCYHAGLQQLSRKETSRFL
jgi:hypothetical protein